ncbi:hypothetical protein POX_f07827 [Penicillium oxalicum]|uniref:hypothetical protein n=1 Tax=Penicillium oxalicum TaxID=69781 RepID=UPI0020B6F263|nr:hypothetical protein POX_f07827 [Penicillium oxalicum]KAI2787463.1 hypothetical protein POX_f07827 [Penicillium oxalicum]
MPGARVLSERAWFAHQVSLRYVPPDCKESSRLEIANNATSSKVASKIKTRVPEM